MNHGLLTRARKKVRRRRRRVVGTSASRGGAAGVHEVEEAVDVALGCLHFPPRRPTALANTQLKNAFMRKCKKKCEGC